MDAQDVNSDLEEKSELVVPESLIETLLRAEDMYWGLAERVTEVAVKTFSSWVESRVEIFNSQICHPDTTYDVQLKKSVREPFPLITGEGSTHRNCSIAAFAGRFLDRSSLLFRLIRYDFLNRHPGPLAHKEMLKTGIFCCEKSCSLQYQRALALLDHDLYLSQEPAFMRALQAKRSGKRRWSVYPFYYTVLCLDDIGTDAARDELHEIAGVTSHTLGERYKSEARHDRARCLTLSILSRYR